MSVYLPKIELYPLFDLNQLDTRDPTPRGNNPNVTVFPVIPPIDETPESTVVPLPDIRITNKQAQPLRLSQTADDHFVESRNESARKESHGHHHKVTFRHGLHDEEFTDGLESIREEDERTLSPRDKRLLLGRKKLVPHNSSGRVCRRVDSQTHNNAVHVPLLDHVPYEGPLSSRQIRRKFAQAIKAVMSIRKLAAIMIKKSEEPSAMLQTFTAMNDPADNFSENLKNQGLSFDPSYFKANKEISISSEVKNILNMPPSSRSQEQIQTAMYGLQSLPSFAEYPLHMQEKLTKVAWYEKVSPKRTIIRQGHYAENFYFILSGQAVVTLTIYDPKTNEPLPRTANFMRKGTSFGELALLHHSRRTATVTSHDTVQLLSIGREDFFDIFMSRQGNDDIPEHIKFISQLDFMKGWPLQRLLEHPEHCLLHFFKRNMVIVNDSKQSDWLYIVKSGSCQVLKQLRSVTAKLGMRKQEATVDDRYHLPHTGTSLRGPKVDTGLLRFRPKSDRSLAESSDFSEETVPSPPIANDLKMEVKGSQIRGCHETRRPSTAGRGGGTERRSTKLPPPSSLHNISTNGTPSSSLPSTIAGSKSSKKFSKESYLGMPTTGKAHFRSSKPSSTPRLKDSYRQRTSISTDSTPRSGPPAPPPPVFVQVSRLKPRDVFGLEFVRFHEDLDHVQTSVNLVSRGAECIMLSKDFFCKHANEMVKKNVQELVRPYPDEVTFQESLQRKADWDLFKHTLIEDITSLPVR